MSNLADAVGLQARVFRWLKRLLAAYVCLVFLAVGYFLAHILHWPFPLVMTLWAPLACVVAILPLIGCLWAFVILLPSKKRLHADKHIET